MALSHTVVRRSIEVANNALSKPTHGDGDDEEKPVNPVALLVIVLTMLAFAVILFAVSSIAPLRPIFD